MSEQSDTPNLSRQTSLSTTQKPSTTSRPLTASVRTRPNTAVNEKACNVQVVVRCRPQNEREKRDGETLICSTADGTEVHVNIGNAQKTGQLKSTSTKRTFTFDHVYNAQSEQHDVYNGAVKPLVEEVLAGFNCTVFAYGQTGTGKTHTMEGDVTNTSDVRNKNAGVISRSIHTIFDELQAANLDAIVKCSFMELYNEDLSDLLAERLPNTSTAPSQSDDTTQLRLMENTEKGVIVQGLEEIVVRSAADVFHLLGKAHARRRVAETLMNKNSSRSHCVFTITVSITEQSDEGEDVVRIGKLHLVDLAGSECVGRSGATAGRAVEAGNINKSLLTLGRVINALVQKDQHIPYRESKLTRLLQESLGGKAKTVIIATISPSSSSLDETLSTLDYAYRAKNIKNKPQINEKKSGKTYMRELQLDIQALKRELEVQRSKNGIIIAQEQYDTFVANSKSSSILIAELEAKIKTKEEELAVVEKSLTDTQQLLQLTTEQRDTTQHKLEETEAVVVATKQQLHDTECVLDQTKQTLATTQTTLKHTQFNVDTHKYVIEQQCNTEQVLTQQAAKLKTVVETVIEDKNALHSKIDRLNTVASNNKHAATTFESTMTQQLTTGKQQLAEHSTTQTQNVNSMIESIKQHNVAHDQHSDKMIMSLSNELNTLQQNISTLSSIATEHITATTSHIQSAQQQYQKCYTTTMDKSLLLQSAVSTHNDKLKSSIDEVSNGSQAALKQIVTRVDEYVDCEMSQYQSMRTGIESLTSTQQQHSNQQTTNLTTVNAALQAFITAQQQAADEQSQVLFNNIQSLVESFKKQQMTAMTTAITHFMSQIQATVTAEQSHVTSFAKNCNDIVGTNMQFTEKQKVSQTTLLQHVQSYDTDMKQYLSTMQQSVTASAVITDKTIDEMKSIHEQQLNTVNDQYATQQQYIDTFKQQHTAQIDTISKQSKQSVDTHISTAQKHNTFIHSNADMVTAELQKQIEHINTHSTTADKFVSSIDQSVHSYIYQQIQYDAPTATTPSKRKFVYPTDFTATEEHPVLKQSFTDKHSYRLQSEPHIPYQPVYTDETPRISVKRQSIHRQQDSMSFAVETSLPSIDTPISQVPSPMSTVSESMKPSYDTEIDQENVEPVVASRPTRSRGKVSGSDTLKSSGISKMKQPSAAAPLSDKSNMVQ